MAEINRRQVLAGAAATVAAAAIPAGAGAADLPPGLRYMTEMARLHPPSCMTGITWDGSPPKMATAAGWRWEDRLRKLLWVRDDEGWICAIGLTDPTPVALDNDNHRVGPRAETYVLHYPSKGVV
jgi:hypothetical protein